MKHLSKNAPTTETDSPVKTAGILGLNLSSLLIAGALLYWLTSKK